MKYLVSHFTIQCSDGEFMQPAREITAAIAGECGYETFLDTDDGIDGYVQVDLFHEPSVREALENFPMDGVSVSFETEEVEDQDWNEVWKQFYKPFRAGTRLVVKPTWEAYEAQEGDLIIEMDPGMAFGSGTHETTGMCLALLETVVTPGSRVIDVGTGSGILAIGAGLLGATDVLAVDIDPTAVKVAKENIEHNHMEKTVRPVVGNLLDGMDDTCDICVANIIADVIISFAAPLLTHIRPGGTFICSGIIREREEDVRTALLSAGYSILRTEHRGEWTAFLSQVPGGD